MFLKKIRKYDGTLLHHRFAYEYFREKTSALGNIIIFRGPMEVLADGMIDQEDVLNEAFIWSDDALNILWEIPLLGNNAFGAVSYQRLFNSLIADCLAAEKYLDLPITMKGDDIMVDFEGNGQDNTKKCSVSITHIKDNAALGHTGINIKAGPKAPAIAYSAALSETQIETFASEVIMIFNQLNHELFIATSKIISK